MVYRGQNTLVMESKIQDGCRVLLDRKDLIKLQYLEWSIFETTERKTNFISPIILQQFKQISTYLKSRINQEKLTTKEEIINFIKGVNDELIIRNISKYDYNYVSQIKLYATEQLSITVMTNDVERSKVMVLYINNFF